MVRFLYVKPVDGRNRRQEHTHAQLHKGETEVTRPCAADYFSGTVALLIIYYRIVNAQPH